MSTAAWFASATSTATICSCGGLGFGVGGCPPGLAKKPVACMPPGQAAKLVGQPLIAANRFGALAPVPMSLRNLYCDNDDYYYRYGGGYMYRVDRDDDLISAMIPLFGAALIGQPLQPSYLNSYSQPSYFNSFYPNSPYDCHRYGYGYVYETDCMTGTGRECHPDLRQWLWRRADDAGQLQLLQRAVSRTAAISTTMTTIITAMRRARSTRSTAKQR